MIENFTLTLARVGTVRSVGDMVASFFFSYRRPNEAEDLKLRQEIARVEPEETRDRIMQLTNPWIKAGKQEGLQQGLQQGLQRGLRQGIDKGHQQGEAELVLRLLRRRLGALSATQEKAIRKLPLRKIEALGEALLEFAAPGGSCRMVTG